MFSFTDMHIFIHHGILILIFMCITFNAAYALYGQPCSNNSKCNWENEVCINGRCGCNDHTRSAWNYDFRHECDEYHIKRCKTADDCIFNGMVCNKNNICECAPREVFVGYVCYKIDKPNPKSFLKHCVPNMKFYGADEFEKEIYGTEIPFCHPEDNVFCSEFLKHSSGDDVISGRCICYPGFYGDNKTKLCRPKSEFLKDNNLTEYKVKPGLYCFGDEDCIEGLNCKENFCQCPDGCVYKEKLESCDCGDYYDSDEYWALDYVWPSIVGTVLGLMMSCFWCVRIYKTVDQLTPNKTRGDTPLVDPSALQGLVSIPSCPAQDNAISMAAGSMDYPPSGAPPLTPKSENLPYSLDSGNIREPSEDNGTDYDTNPLPYAPPPYGPEPCSSQLFGPQPYGSHSSAFSEPPPSYSETLARDANHHQVSSTFS